MLTWCSAALHRNAHCGLEVCTVIILPWFAFLDDFRSGLQLASPVLYWVALSFRWLRPGWDIVAIAE